MIRLRNRLYTIEDGMVQLKVKALPTKLECKTWLPAFIPVLRGHPVNYNELQFCVIGRNRTYTFECNCVACAGGLREPVTLTGGDKFPSFVDREAKVK